MPDTQVENRLEAIDALCRHLLEGKLQTEDAPALVEGIRGHAKRIAEELNPPSAA